MRCGFTGMAQKLTNSHLTGRAHCLHSQKCKRSLLRCEECAHCFLWHSWSCASWICYRRTDYKPALLHWQLGEMSSGIYLKSGIRTLVSPPWQDTFSLCFEHEFLADDNVSVAPQHSLCLPESSPCDFLFSRTQEALNGRRFGYATMIQGKL